MLSPVLALVIEGLTTSNQGDEAMPETLLSSSNVLLYGRVLRDLKFEFVPPDKPGPNQKTSPPPRLCSNNFLLNQLKKGDVHPARIYGFSYEGHYYDLPRPAIFLVHGPGDDPELPRPAAPRARVSRAPSDADRTGTANQDYSFAEDMRVWSYDKADFSVRLDVETGPFEQILLEAAVRPEKLQHYSGADLRISGADLRIRRNRGGNLGD